MRKIVPLLFMMFLLVGCSEKKAEYDPYASRESDEILNKYEGGGADFHLSRWYPSEAGQITEKTVDNVTTVEYTKNVDFEYTNVYTTVMGRFADFNYINICAKGTPGKAISMRMYYGKGENELANVLGDDVSFSLSEDFQVHTLKVKNTCKTKMDLLRKVCIFPEIGLANTSGTFYFNDVWFSKDMPANAKWENEGVDTGDSSVRVNGWRTENWTQYTLYALGTKTGVRYTKAADYAYIEKSIDIPEGNNGLEFKFENTLISNKQSVTCIRFLLRGDVERHVTEGVEYPYDIYYESLVYHYDLSPRKDNEVAPDSSGITTLRFSLASGLEAIGEHHTNGYRLTLLIESHPEDGDQYKRYRNGEMVIHEMSTFYDVNFDLGGWMSEPWTHYTIQREEGKLAVSYSSTAESGTIQKRIKLNSNDNAIEFKFENVLFESVRSISNMRFYLRGDFKEHVKPAVGDEYDLYYEDELYAYDVNKDYEVEPDEQGQITLKMPLMDALNTIGEHNKDGYFLKVFIESHVDDGNDYANSSGKMFITNVRSFHDDWVEFNLDGWEVEEWTNYNLVGSTEGVHLRYKQVGQDYAFVMKPIEIGENDNVLVFQFKNNLINSLPSVSCMRILIRGDLDHHVDEGDYDIFFEKEIYAYDLIGKVDEVEPDENGVTTLRIPLYQALDTLENHHDGGYFLKLLVESHPDDETKFASSKDGDMYIKDVSTVYDSSVKYDPYYVDETDDATYTLSDKADVEKNITYTNMVGGAFYPRIIRRIKNISQSSHILVKVRNNGVLPISFGIRAGILEDERGTNEDHKFYPLWDVEIDHDGQTVDIDPGEEHEFDISMNRSDLLESDVINALNIFIDNNHKDSTDLYSGDVDIIYVNIVS